MNDINSSILNNQYQKLRDDIAKQDVYRAFVLNANSTAPQKARGYLLKSRNPVSSVIIGAGDTVKDVVELGKALSKGESNDNQLGRFNDLGMKLGGLGIASYLFTRRGTTTKGLMEFLGFGAFFASMAMWPRVLISEPMKMRFGFDFRQKYVDSQGRKKYFFQDNQYQPWDLWSKEDLNKVGDKLNVPKDVKDREELIKEKMRSIALQGNTLWMLSAGFSPLLTSMICNLGERGVTRYLVNSKYNKILSEVDNMEAIIADRIKNNPDFDAKVVNKLQSLIEDRTKEPDKAFFGNVSICLDPFRELISTRDLDDGNLVADLSSFAPRIRKRLEADYNVLKTRDYVPSSIDYGEFMRRLKKMTKGEHGRMDLQASKPAVGAEIFASLKRQLDPLSVKVDEFKTIVAFDDFCRAFEVATANQEKCEIQDAVMGLAKQFLKKEDADPRIVEEFCQSIGEMYTSHTRPLSAQVRGIDDFINGLVGQKYESVHTMLHLDSLNEFMKQLSPTMDDLKIARNSTDNAKSYLVGALSSVAQDKGNRYGDFISSITAKQANLETKTIDIVLKKVEDYANRTIGKAFGKISDDSPFAFYKKEVSRFGADGSVGKMPLYEKVIKLFVEEKGAGIKATGHRYILAADLEKRIQTGELEAFWKELGGSEEVFEQVKKICRDIMYDGTMNDLSNKFYMDGNGIEAPKVIKLLFGISDNLGEDKKPLFGMSKATIENCDKKMLDSLNATRRNIYNIYASAADLARQGHTLQGGIDACQKTQYSMVGKSVSELFMETASQKFNDKTWLKTFGGIGLAVLGITLVSQMFFGKVKHEHLYKKEKSAQGGVDASK